MTPPPSRLLLYAGLASPETVSSNLNEPLLGVHELGRETIGVVGESITVLEAQTVPIIPFGVLQIDTRSTLFHSSDLFDISSVVTFLEVRPVSIKVSFMMIRSDLCSGHHSLPSHSLGGCENPLLHGTHTRSCEVILQRGEYVTFPCSSQHCSLPRRGGHATSNLFSHRVVSSWLSL